MPHQYCKRIEGLCRMLALSVIICSPAGPVVGEELQSQTPAPYTNDRSQSDPQVKAVIDRMAAAGVLHPTTVEEVRKAICFIQLSRGSPNRSFGSKIGKFQVRPATFPSVCILPIHRAVFPSWFFSMAEGSWQEASTAKIRLSAA